MITGIVAIAKNFAIGKEGKLPWHYSADLKFFKETTTGNAIVMGANTFDSIGKALPNRLNIVMSRQRHLAADVLVLRNKESLIGLSNYLNCEIFIIGGGGVYREFFDLIERWIVTEIPQNIEDADTFMPPNFLDNFNEKSSEIIGDKLIVKIYEKI